MKVLFVHCYFMICSKCALFFMPILNGDYSVNVCCMCLNNECSTYAYLVVIS